MEYLRKGAQVAKKLGNQLLEVMTNSFETYARSLFSECILGG